MRPSNSVEWLVVTLYIHVLPASNFGPEAAVLTDGGFVLSSSVALEKARIVRQNKPLPAILHLS